MKPFYTRPERIGALSHAVNAWQGTPFRKRGRLKGAGVDCVNLVIAIYGESGFPVRVDLPHYGLSDGLCRADAGPIIEWLEACPAFLRVGRQGEPVSPPAPGDLLCFSIGMSVHHLGVALDPLRFTHVLQGYSVGVSPTLDSTYASKLQAVYRPMEMP
jgi:cell wall-associated NlpC family hydrolase